MEGERIPRRIMNMEKLGKRLQGKPSKRWEEQIAASVQEKKSLLTNTLSIRGGEETILGALHTDGNLNLLVPEN
uniref:Uncharacterized protein n=1 Tax=Timema shepardi TaxID=629360 RepID=A0A7R9AZB4_TIMSH|nr:unnamed protein product [Timema shepardi]